MKAYIWGLLGLIFRNYLIFQKLKFWDLILKLICRLIIYCWCSELRCIWQYSEIEEQMKIPTKSLSLTQAWDKL